MAHNVGALQWLGIWNTTAQLPAKAKLKNKRLGFIRQPNYCKTLCYGLAHLAGFMN
jgi:hypothetical protein